MTEVFAEHLLVLLRSFCPRWLLLTTMWPSANPSAMKSCDFLCTMNPCTMSDKDMVSPFEWHEPETLSLQPFRSSSQSGCLVVDNSSETSPLLKPLYMDSHTLGLFVAAIGGFNSLLNFFLLMVSYLGGNMRPLSICLSHITEDILEFLPCMFIYLHPITNFSIDKAMVVFIELVRVLPSFIPLDSASISCLCSLSLIASCCSSSMTARMLADTLAEVHHSSLEEHLLVLLRSSYPWWIPMTIMWPSANSCTMKSS
ncbi:hypothetical protein HPG69_011224 [Diceros bicornis minor]|uniref:G-protein coupled receptors family 1 profile domain-containing protein n=1 Tax=Diceros bicornis minor TaxID=77932 RepID=A0A7J7EYM4_DICBM|nr:hypothetical protein HPG69_011224 [Diceros bicornis minor]